MTRQAALASRQKSEPARPRRHALSRRDSFGTHAGVSHESRDDGDVPSAVHEVMETPGRPLDGSTRSLMESYLSRDFGGMAVRPVSTRRMRLGPRQDVHERQAESIATSVPRVQNNGANSRPKRSAGALDLGGVQIHSGPKAAEAARSVDAQAYAVGHHIILGAGQQALSAEARTPAIAHELTHVIQQTRAGGVQPGVVQRVGIFESIARFFGGGTFSDDELNAYLEGLQRGKIEDEMDSDNKARAVAKRGLYDNAKYDWKTRSLLVQELLSGFTGSDDREAILTILSKTKEQSPDNLERIVTDVGTDKLLKKFSGDDRDKLYVIIGSVERHKKDPVATDWMVGYTVKGAEELRGRSFGLVVDELVATPENGTPTLVAQGATNANLSGAAVKVAGGLDLPRGQGGTGSLAFHVAPRAKDGTVPAEPGVGPRLSEPYPPVTLDKRRVTATINIEYAREKSGEVTSTAGREVQHGTEQESSSKRSTGVTTSAEQKRSVGLKQGAGKEITKGQEQQKSEESSTTDTSTFTGTVSLSIKVTPEISAALKGKVGAGLQLDGKLLGMLLGAALEAEGGELLALLGEKGVLPSTSFSVEGSAEVGFKLTVELKGEVALQWSKSHSTTFKKGTIQSQKNEEKERKEAEVSVGGEATQGRQESRGTEVTSGRKVSTVNKETTGTAKTTSVFTPVIDKAGVKFEVT